MEALVQNYAKGVDLLMAALDGVSEEELLFKPAENKWSIKEVVIHVCDAEMVSTDRMKRIIAEDNPLLFKFDPDAWALRLNYQALDIQAYLAMFGALRFSMSAILSGLSNEDWQRTGVHNVAGKQTLQDVVQMFIGHVDRHIQQIERNKQAFATRG
ncbi:MULTISPECIES: DinB family protein [unclassified Paenibacillus]|uniref:DinB family protein n=1 Tax=unclassified Paenibacillus TaxID=185978 RepID=UPI001AE84DBF|nr:MULTISPECIES: DinB family protein [unclassified Paenibacillus]MBP1155485.1 putative damage-inducible protein DinB [Paenibacillus sp. PvP091]MBP1169129.1 putative damage-inducible protein DinB [Paenibacillus sp. PvR098]MBP2440157.1 putative damage-inducible protein DinB [Paenibacillus sp. PvP052]